MLNRFEPPALVNDVNSPVSMTSSAEYLTFSETYAWSLDIDSGELIESLPATRWTTANRSTRQHVRRLRHAVSARDAIYLASATN